jgi:hypothetical protein
VEDGIDLALEAHGKLKHALPFSRKSIYSHDLKTHGKDHQTNVSIGIQYRVTAADIRIVSIHLL